VFFGDKEVLVLAWRGLYNLQSQGAEMLDQNGLMAVYDSYETAACNMVTQNKGSSR
jgi:hypothetical protein